MTNLRDGTSLPDPSLERLRARILRNTEVVDGCWIWQRYLNDKGYGKCQAVGVGQLAHRVAYHAFVGPIPDGLTIDHLCRKRACVNPVHLEVVTQAENSMRGDTIPARHAAKTRCTNGHPLSGENMRISANQRRCRACERAAGARYRHKIRTEKARA